MGLSFNGTTSKLEYTGNVVTSYPYTQFIWVKMRAAALSGNCAPIGAGQWGAGSELSILTIGSTDVRAQSRDGSASNFAVITTTIASEVWVPAMAVFNNDHDRTIYWGAATPVQETSTNAPTLASLDRLRIGVRAYDDTLWAAMDAAHAAVWSSALTAGNFTSLAAAAVPSTIAAGTLTEYWSLATQAATQTGLNGRVLTASNTSQSADDPIASGGGSDNPQIWIQRGARGINQFGIRR